MATKTDIELKIVDSVDTSHTEAEVLTDSAANPDAFYVGRGYLAHNGEKVIEGIDPNGSYPNMTVGNAQKAKEAESATHADTATDLSGRVEATPEVFTYRPSAGEKSIKDDNAFIRRVKGNSVVWNQLVKNALDQSGNNGWWSRQGANNVELNGSSIKLSFVSGTSSTPQISQKIPLNANHTYFLTVNIDFNVSNDAVCFLRESSNLYGDSSETIIRASSDGHYNAIFTPTDGYSYLIFSVYHAINDVGDSVTVSDMQIIDLTAMFDAGNEPTAEEFRELYPNSYYPYNAGELRNLDCSGIKTVGFNQWDGTTQVGYIRDTTGQVFAAQDFLCTDFIRVIPNQKYYINTEQTNGRWGAWYDANKNHIAGIIGYDQGLTAPSTAAYVRLTIKTDVSGNPDTFCFNLSHTGVRDGEYEPYKEVTHLLPLSQITNGEPLRKAGSVFDEINETEYIKRVGVVDLGTLTWTYSNNEFVSLSIESLMTYPATGRDTGNILCSKYSSHPYTGSSLLDKVIFTSWQTAQLKAIWIKDSAYSDAASFKTAMSGVMLNYELAEPIVTPIETPIDFNYYVEDFGTEEALLAEDSAPFSADIVYQFNATDQIRNNTRNIHKLNDIFSGSKGEYVRADGSWGYIADLKGNFFVKPTLKRIRTGISELSDTIQIIHPYLTEHVGDAKIVLMAVKRRGGTYYNESTNAKGRRKKRKAWGELHYAAMPNTEINHNTIEMPNGASFEAWQNVILLACGRIPEGLENAREPYNVNVASEDLADFFAANGAIFVGKTPVIRLGVALRIPNPNFIDYGNGNKMWDYNDVTGKWEYKYLYSDVAEVVVKSQMLRTGGYVLGLELV